MLIGILLLRLPQIIQTGGFLAAGGGRSYTAHCRNRNSVDSGKMAGRRIEREYGKE